MAGALSANRAGSPTSECPQGRALQRRRLKRLIPPLTAAEGRSAHELQKIRWPVCGRRGHIPRKPPLEGGPEKEMNATMTRHFSASHSKETQAAIRRGR